VGKESMNLTRRTFVQAIAGASAAATPFSRLLPLAHRPASAIAPARFAVITDLHFGLAPDALPRFDAFLTELPRHRFDVTLQMGDFCYSDAGAAECLKRWDAVRGRRMSILGNHDLDKCDKDTAARAFGMTHRYYAEHVGGYRFVVLDLNNFRKNDVTTAYANGNYAVDGVTSSCADPEQLAWLRQELLAAKTPVIVLSHQPLGFADPGQPLPVEQQEIFDVIAACGAANPAGRVGACLSGHWHVDRLEHVAGIPCLIVNSASYYWFNGMYPYSKPLYSFIDFTADGMLKVTGAQGEFAKTPPPESDKVIGRAATISDRAVGLAATGR
jgi:3',5'-cyclic AMP phosphodiesterase CpdA